MNMPAASLRARWRLAFAARVNRLRDKSCLEVRAKGPGLKPIDSIGLIQGAEAPCSLPKKAKASAELMWEKGMEDFVCVWLVGVLRARKTRSG